LNDKERLVKRTQLVRNKTLGFGFPTKEEYDENIFDDTDFYQQLLREFIDSKLDKANDPMAIAMRYQAMKNSKARNTNVDRKASKGRKIRFHVHPKLCNFMAPTKQHEWEDDKIDDLFNSLQGL
jgi:protein AATF/BFR2